MKGSRLHSWEHCTSCGKQSFKEDRKPECARPWDKRIQEGCRAKLGVPALAFHWTLVCLPCMLQRAYGRLDSWALSLIVLCDDGCVVISTRACRRSTCWRREWPIVSGGDTACQPNWIFMSSTESLTNCMFEWPACCIPGMRSLLTPLTDLFKT